MSETVEVPTDRNSGNYRDAHGRALADYPRPSVAVDTAVLTVEPDGSPSGRLAVLQVRRAGSHRRGVWALPGTFLHEGERLADAVDRSLREKAGIAGVKPRQLRVFDDPTRDERGWVLSVAHVDVLPHARLAEVVSARDDVRLAAAVAPGRLPYDHAAIVADAVADVRARYTVAPDPDHLLARTFTLRDLRLLHEAVAKRSLQRDTFRRLVEPHLAATGRCSAGTVGRPAELFRHR